MSTVTLETIRDLGIADIAALSSEDLFEVRMQATNLLSAVKQLADKIDQALDRKYAEAAQVLRRAQGKDTGIVHFDDGSVRITADLPKKVEWDQLRLADIMRRIAAAGEDPAEYVEISYRVSETKFNAWPESIRSVFAPARTLKTGKCSFRLALLDGGDA
jgi:tetrahydromethanopterin S-methyltransferase subunit G